MIPCSPENPAPNNTDTGVYIKGGRQGNFNKKIVRKIQGSLPDGTSFYQYQAILFHSDSAVYNDVTGEVTYYNWTPVQGKNSVGNTFNEYVLPSYKGYEPSSTGTYNAVVYDEKENVYKVPALKEDPNDDGFKAPLTGVILIGITYNPYTHIIYKDTNGNVIHTDTIKSNTDRESTVDTNSNVPNGYKIADSSIVKEVPQKITFTNGETVPDTIITVAPINAQKVEIKFIDDDNNKKQVGNSIFEEGPAGGTVSSFSNLTVPAGYDLADGQKLPTNYTFTTDSNQKIEIHLVHKKITVNGNNPLLDGAKTSTGVTINGAHKADLSKVYERQIGVSTPDKKLNKIIQEVTLISSATYDDVNGTVTYNNDWTTGKFNKYSAPDIAGYKTGKPAPEETVYYTPDEQRIKFFIIRYTPLNQVGKISYVDQDKTDKVNNPDKYNTEVSQTPLNGKTDESVTVTPTAPAGWEVVPGQNIPGTVIATADGVPTVTVKVQHKQVTVTPDNPKTPQDKLPDNPGKTYPGGVGQADLHKTVTRTINVTDPQGHVKTTTQTVTFQRTAIVDEVDGTLVKYGDWTNADDQKTWNKFTTPTVDGYTPSQAGLDKVTVKAGDKDQTINITYTANNQITHIIYKDNDGNVIKTDTVTGKTDQTVKTNSKVPAGWKITGDAKVPTTITFKGASTPDIIIPIEHQIDDIQPNNPVTPGTKTPTSKDINGAHDSDLNQTITRIINVTDPSGKTTTTTQTAHITRTATVDEVTGEVTYNPWTTDDSSWAKVDVPEIPDFTPSQTSVEAVIVKDGQKDQIINITYTQNTHTNTVTYIDEHGKTVKTDKVTGKIGDKITVNIPNGYHAKDGQIPNLVISDTPVHIVNIVKDQVTPTPGKDNTKGNNNTPVIDNNGNGETTPTVDNQPTNSKGNVENGGVGSVTPNANESNTNSSATTNNNVSASNEQLPQTGNHAAQSGLLVGLTAMLSALGLGLGKKRKHE